MSASKNKKTMGKQKNSVISKGLVDKYGKQIYIGDEVSLHYSNGFSWGTVDIDGKVTVEKHAVGIKTKGGKFYPLCDMSEGWNQYVTKIHK